MCVPADYERQVYTAVLGKVIGVYLGRPYEGWDRDSIQKKWGMITRYVHEDQNVPLIVIDDDISGTLTFIRALEDSGLYQETPDDFYGKTWLNYLLENQTILWWGGVSNSTEHTAYYRLKNGIPSPESGSAARNGKIVAEQIGAQIFIDAFGMAAPGNPALAVSLAQKAASVSHDGEAVNAAKAVAAMISLAFCEKDIYKVMDHAVQYIPADSLIARIHRDVRKWAEEDKNWEKTYGRIKETYGYHIYGGNCHVVPNHAVMVMAWSYGGNNFHKAMSIVCSAGWDTDCNAANVGTVSALIAGLDHLTDDYDFLTPFADRVYVTAADGTDSAADAFRHALRIAAYGRKAMGADSLPKPKNGVWHSFEMEHALHGYMPDDSTNHTRGNAVLKNIPAPGGFLQKRCLSWEFISGPGIASRILTPVSVFDGGHYGVVSVPYIYPGMTLTVRGRCVSGTGTLRLFMVSFNDEKIYFRDCELKPDMDFHLVSQIEKSAQSFKMFGMEIISGTRQNGLILIDSVDCGGKADIADDMLKSNSARGIPGWISNLDNLRGSFSDDSEQVVHIGKNSSDGILITGNRTWRNAVLSCRFKIHAADEAGFILGWQGLQRFYSIVFTHTSVRIVRRYYDNSGVLAEVPYSLEPDKLYSMKASMSQGKLSLSVNDQPVICAEDSVLSCGGCGFYVSGGLCGFRDYSVAADIDRTDVF